MFSDGMNFITDDEFVRLLLRRTRISDIKKARYVTHHAVAGLLVRGNLVELIKLTEFFNIQGFRARSFV